MRIRLDFYLACVWNYLFMSKSYNLFLPISLVARLRCIEKRDAYMHLLHFKPTDGYVGDIIPFYNNGKYHVFYLKCLEGLNDSPSVQPLEG